MSDEKVVHSGGVLDHDVLGDKGNLSHDEAMHFGELTPEEKEIEKKLVRKIDARIMPLMVMVYLMNYIDRYDSRCCPWSTTNFPVGPLEARSINMSLTVI